MAHGNRRQPYEAAEGRVEDVALDRAADGIGTIQDHHLDARLGAGFQTAQQRPDECVVTRADILEVDHQHVETVEHGRRRLAAFAVERVHRQPRAGVAVPFPLDHVVLRLSAQAVLRAEERAQVVAERRVQQRHRVAESAVDACGVREQADAASMQTPGVLLDEPIQSGTNVSHGDLPVCAMVRQSAAPAKTVLAPTLDAGSRIR